MWYRELGTFDTTTNRVDVKPAARSGHQNAYRKVPYMRPVTQSSVEKEPRAGLIEATKIDWGSPVVFPPKGHENLRLFVD